MDGRGLILLPASGLRDVVSVILRMGGADPGRFAISVACYVPQAARNSWFNPPLGSLPKELIHDLLLLEQSKTDSASERHHAPYLNRLKP